MDENQTNPLLTNNKLTLKEKLAELSKRGLDAIHPHTKFFEFAFQILVVAISFIRFALRDRKILSRLILDKLQVKPKNFLNPITFKGSEADMVYSIPLIDDDEQEIIIYTLLEHKSTNDYNTIRQMARYYTHLTFMEDLEETKSTSEEKSSSEEKSENKPSDTKPTKKKSKKLPLVVPIVIHNGPVPYTGPTELKEFYPNVEGAEDFMINFKPIIIDLTTIDLNKLSKDPNDILFNIVITIMKLVFLEERFEDVEKCFLELFPIAKEKPEYLEFAQTAIAYFWVASHTDRNRFINLLKDHYPQDREEGENTVLSLLEESRLKGHREGIEEGFEKGIKQGIEQGIEQGKRSTLLLLLKRRFRHIPTDVKSRIESIGDAIVLDSLCCEAAQCESMEEFRKAL